MGTYLIDIGTLGCEAWCGARTPCSWDMPPKFLSTPHGYGTSPFHISTPPTSLDGCGFFNSVVVRLPFNSISDGSEWGLFYMLAVILMWLCEPCLHRPPSWPSLLSHCECTATQYTCSLNSIYHPHWLAQWSCYCSCMCIPGYSPWLPGYIYVMQTILIILTMAVLFPDRSLIYVLHLLYSVIHQWTLRFLPYVGIINNVAMNIGMYIRLQTLNPTNLWPHSIHSSSQLFNEYLLIIYFVSATVLGTGNTVVNKTDKNIHFYRA